MTSASSSPVRFVPPPLMFVAAFLAGIALGRVVPDLTFVSPVAEALGWILLALGIAIGPGSALAFAARRTTLIPHGTPSRLVTGGIYRLTRNPMYLGMSVAYLGLSLLLGKLGPLFLLPLPVLAIDRTVIPMEEARLREVFGDAYERYTTRVRRWL